MRPLFLIILYLFLSNSCEKSPLVEKFYSIIIINNSSQVIRVLVANELADNQYPDTNLPYMKPNLLRIPAYERTYLDSKTSWEDNLDKLPADTLSIVFIDENVYDNEPWDSVRVNYQVLSRLDLSIEDLKANNYTIAYP